MDEFELLDRPLLGGCLDVRHLPADHPARVDGLGDLARGAQLPLRVHDRFGQPGERLGQQRVAGEDADRLAVDDVRRLASAPQVVVVDGREIVVDQRIGMDQLQRADGHEQRLDVGAAGLGGCHGQDRADAFSAAEDRIAHRVVDARRWSIGGREVAVQ